MADPSLKQKLKELDPALTDTDIAAIVDALKRELALAGAAGDDFNVFNYEMIEDGVVLRAIDADLGGSGAALGLPGTFDVKQAILDQLSFLDEADEERFGRQLRERFDTYLNDVASATGSLTLQELRDAAARNPAVRIAGEPVVNYLAHLDDVFVKAQTRFRASEAATVDDFRPFLQSFFNETAPDSKGTIGSELALLPDEFADKETIRRSDELVDNIEEARKAQDKRTKDAEARAKLLKEQRDESRRAAMWAQAGTLGLLKSTATPEQLQAIGQVIEGAVAEADVRASAGLTEAFPQLANLRLAQAAPALQPNQFGVIDFNDDLVMAQSRVQQAELQFKQAVEGLTPEEEEQLGNLVAQVSIPGSGVGGFGPPIQDPTAVLGPQAAALLGEQDLDAEAQAFFDKLVGNAEAASPDGVPDQEMRFLQDFAKRIAQQKAAFEAERDRIKAINEKRLESRARVLDPTGAAPGQPGSILGGDLNGPKDIPVSTNAFAANLKRIPTFDEFLEGRIGGAREDFIERDNARIRGEELDRQVQSQAGRRTRINR